MANDDDGGLPAGGGNCSLEELLQIARANLKDCEAQARPHREAQLSSRGDRDLRKARRHEIPAPPELSESDEEGIRHQRSEESNRTPLLYQDKTTIEDYSTQAYIGLGNSIEHSHNGQDKDMLDKAMPVEEKGHRKITPFFIPYTITNMGSALLAIDLGFIGPNYSISTACAPSNYCFYAAANHIRGGETDMMIAGGTEAAIIPIGFGVFVVYLNKKSIDELAEIKHGSSWTPTVEKIAYWRTAKAKTIQVHTLYDLHISSSSSSSRLNSRYSPGIVFNFTIYLLL
ncbi:hypothetical protein QYF36_003603 [Acer negundo]|nr:hypothetical protein QYF36_003603 [Acer negundo]